jgi:hypothetical protein
MMNRAIALLLVGGIAACGKDEDDTDDVVQATAHLSSNKVFIWDANADGVPDTKPGQPGSVELTGASSGLVRYSDHVQGTFRYTGAIEGDVISLWYGVFNAPENCKDAVVSGIARCGVADLMDATTDSSIIFAGSAVAGADGVVLFGSTLYVGDASKAQTGMGLKDALKADIHLVPRNHGQASTDPTVLNQQLTTFNGGCAMACPNVAVSPHEPEKATDFTGKVSENKVFFWDANMDGVPDGKANQAGFVEIGDGKSTLIRDGDNIYATYDLHNLTPGNVITLWFGAFNYPDKCMEASVDGIARCGVADLMNMDVKASIIFAKAAAIVREDGTATLGGVMTKGDTASAVTGMGLLEPATADIHVVSRIHGPLAADTASIALQMSTFNGGCAMACPNYTITMHEARETAPE